jgi:hypothetical protein
MMLRVGSKCTGIDPARRARNAVAGRRTGRDEADYYRHSVGLPTQAPGSCGHRGSRRDIAPRTPFSDLIPHAFSAHQARERGGCRMSAA